MTTIIRHMAAVVAAWLITTLVGALGLDVGPEDVAELQAALTTLGTVLLLALYAALEKGMKPLFERFTHVRRGHKLDPEVLARLRQYPAAAAAAPPKDRGA